MANHARFLVNGDSILPQLLADLRSARREIHISMFLFFRDPIGERVATVLEERARAGVAVRVLLNIDKTGMGDPFSTGEFQMMQNDPSVDYNPLDVRPLCERMQRAGVKVVNTDIDYDHDFVTDPRLASIAAQVRSAIKVDELHTDHRKIVVIDGVIAYTGGANIGAQYLYVRPFDPAKNSREEAQAWRDTHTPEPWWKWHDSLTRFHGPIAADIDEEFRTRWLLDGGDDYAPQPPLAREAGPEAGAVIAHAKVFTNAPDGTPNAIRALYVEHIRDAKESIFIENPYLYHPAIVEALCEAKRARPALDVVLIVPCGEHNDNAFAQDAQQHFYKAFLERGIEVYEYTHHFNHLKIAVFDARYSVHGSTNLNFRSLEDDKDFELVVLVDDAPFGASLLEQVRDVDRLHAAQITSADVEGLSLRALRHRVRDPRTLLMISQRVL